LGVPVRNQIRGPELLIRRGKIRLRGQMGTKAGERETVQRDAGGVRDPPSKVTAWWKRMGVEENLEKSSFAKKIIKEKKGGLDGGKYRTF